MGRPVNPSQSPAADAAIQRIADRVVDQSPNDPLEILAADMVSDSYIEKGLDIAPAIAAELLRRASSGVRKWPAAANEGNAVDDFEGKLGAEMDKILG
jgi:hypothetical protein